MGDTNAEEAARGTRGIDAEDRGRIEKNGWHTVAAQERPAGESSAHFAVSTQFILE